MSEYVISINTADGVKNLVLLGREADKVGKNFDAMRKRSQISMNGIAGSLSRVTDRELRTFGKGLKSAFYAGAIDAASEAIVSFGGAILELITGQKEAEMRAERYRDIVRDMGDQAYWAAGGFDALRESIERKSRAQVLIALDQAETDYAASRKKLEYWRNTEDHNPSQNDFDADTRWIRRDALATELLKDEYKTLQEWNDKISEELGKGAITMEHLTQLTKDGELLFANQLKRDLLKDRARRDAEGEPSTPKTPPPAPTYQTPRALSPAVSAQDDQATEAQKKFNEVKMALVDFERHYQSAFNKSGMLADSVVAEMDQFRQIADSALALEIINAEKHSETLLRIDRLQHDKMLESARDMASGAERAFRSYADSATDMARNTETFVTGTFNTIGQSFQLTTDGMKFSWKSAMDSILNQSFQMFAVNPILGGIADGIGGLFSPSAGSGVNPLASSMKGAIGRLKNAHGNAFSAGTGLSAYRNSIVTEPTLFAYAHGGIPGSRIGLMGEKAGSPGEVIAPLFRASNGDLGVKSVGGGSSEVHVHVDVHNNSNEQVSVRESRGSNGMPRLDVLIGEVERGIANNIFSGRSPIARAMDRTRGTSSAMSLYWK